MANTRSTDFSSREWSIPAHQDLTASTLTGSTGSPASAASSSSKRALPGAALTRLGAAGKVNFQSFKWHRDANIARTKNAHPKKNDGTLEVPPLRNYGANRKTENCSAQLTRSSPTGRGMPLRGSAAQLSRPAWRSLGGAPRCQSPCERRSLPRSPSAERDRRRSRSQISRSQESSVKAPSAPGATAGRPSMMCWYGRTATN